MMVDIPTKKDFYQASDDLVNQVWDRFADLAYDYRRMSEMNKGYKNFTPDFPEDAEYFASLVVDISDYWDEYQREMNSSLVLILQSVEFRLKGLTADISPYLLISNTPNNLPKLDSDGFISFTDFQMVGANDLIKIYQTFSNERLSEDFIRWFNDLRKQRNKLVHTVDKNSNVNIGVIFKSILFAHKELNKEDSNWMMHRYKYEAARANNDGLFKTIEIGEIDVLPSMHKEFSGVVEQLSPSEAKDLLGFDKRVRGFECPYCYNLMDQSSWDRVNRILDYCYLTVQYNNTKGKYMCSTCNSDYDTEPKIRFDDEE